MQKILCVGVFARELAALQRNAEVKPSLSIKRKLNDKRLFEEDKMGQLKLSFVYLQNYVETESGQLSLL